MQQCNDANRRLGRVDKRRQSATWPHTEKDGPNTTSPKWSCAHVDHDQNRAHCGRALKIKARSESLVFAWRSLLAFKGNTFPPTYS